MTALVPSATKLREEEWLAATAPRLASRWGWRSPSAANRIAHIREFRHRYLLMRHGESTANCLGILCGSEESAAIHPLTPRGVVQVAQGIRAALADGSLPRDAHIVSSPFARAYQSAVVAAGILGQAPEVIHINAALVERNPGRLEGLRYRASRDQAQSDRIPSGAIERLLSRRAVRNVIAAATRCGLGMDIIPHMRIESAVRVLDRTTGLIASLEQSFERSSTFLLVGHEDQMGVLLTALTPFPPGRYWMNRHIPHGAVLPFSREYALARFSKPHSLMGSAEEGHPEGAPPRTLSSSC